MYWKDMTEGARIIIGILDELLFEMFPLAVERFVEYVPIWALVLMLVPVCGLIVYLTLAPTRRGDVSNVGATMLVNAASKASRGLFVIGFYGSILLAFAAVILRNL